MNKRYLLDMEIGTVITAETDDENLSEMFSGKYNYLVAIHRVFGGWIYIFKSMGFYSESGDVKPCFVPEEANVNVKNVVQEG